MLLQAGLVEHQQAGRAGKADRRAQQVLVRLVSCQRHGAAEFPPPRIESRLVQMAHGQHHEGVKAVLGLAGQLDQVLDLQMDFIAMLGQADTRDLRHQPEIAFQPAAKVHQRGAGGQRIAQRVQVGDVDVARHLQPEVLVVGDVDAGAVQACQGGRRQAGHRVVRELALDADRAEDARAVDAGRFQRAGDRHAVAAYGGVVLAFRAFRYLGFCYCH